MEFIKKHNGQLIALFVTVLAAAIFYRLYGRSDIMIHSTFASEYINNDRLPANFLYYWIISTLSFNKEAFLLHSSITVLSIFVLLKYIATNWVLLNLLKNKDRMTINLLSFCLILVSAIYVPQLLIQRSYLGSFTPTIWHNSTTIAVVPFALVLFLVSVQQIKQFAWPRLILISGLIILNLLIKPSYLFVYVGALPFTYLVTRRISRDIFLQALPFFMAIVFIFLQKTMIYGTPQVYSDSSIELGFLDVYQSWHDLQMAPLVIFFTASVVTSIAFPIYVLYKKGLKKTDTSFIFAWISVIGALAIFIFVTETDTRADHGNFMWQVFISVFILFVVSVAKSYKELTARSWKPNLFQILFALHLFMGGLYILRLFVYPSYI